MAQIGIGINEDVFISKVEQDAQSKAILITFNHKDDNTGEINYFEALGGDKVIEPATGTTLRIFAPNEPKKENTEEKRRQFAFNDVAGARNVIEHILEQYMTAEEASAKEAVYANTGLDQNNFNERIVQKPTLWAIHDNLARHFIQKISPFVNRKDLLMRLLLIRQSKDKAFPTFRTKFLQDQPFMESMDVPKEQSKLKFTKYELDNGLNSTDPAPSKDAADKKGEAAAPQSASGVFGSVFQ